MANILNLDGEEVVSLVEFDELLAAYGTLLRKHRQLETELAHVTAQRNEYHEMYWDNRCTCGMNRSARQPSAPSDATKP